MYNACGPVHHARPPSAPMNRTLRNTPPQPPTPPHLRAQPRLRVSPFISRRHRYAVVALVEHVCPRHECAPRVPAREAAVLVAVPEAERPLVERFHQDTHRESAARAWRAAERGAEVCEEGSGVKRDRRVG